MPDNKPTFTAKWKSLQAPPQVEAEVLDARSAKVKDPVDGAEYIIVPAGQTPGAKDWANAKHVTDGKVVFEGLSPAASYDVWARMSETDEAAQSEAVKVPVATSKEQKAGHPLIVNGCPAFSSNGRGPMLKRGALANLADMHARWQRGFQAGVVTTQSRFRRAILRFYRF